MNREFLPFCNSLVSSFQSEYGISFNPVFEAVYDVTSNNTIFNTGVDVHYRLADFVSIGLGYMYTSGMELNGFDVRTFTETGDSGDFNVTRYFRFISNGIKLSGNFYFSPSPRINLGFDVGGIFHLDPVFRQDLVNFPVSEITDSAIPAIDQVGKRIIVDGFNHDLYMSWHLGFTFDFLISKRMSVGIKAGYSFYPLFKPVSFQSAGKVQDSYGPSGEYDDAAAINNGTFSEYNDFDFSKTTTGDWVEFSLHGLNVQLGFSLHF